MRHAQRELMPAIEWVAPCHPRASLPTDAYHLSGRFTASGLYVPTVLGESPGGNTVHTSAKLGFFVRRSAFMNHDDMNTTYTRLISIPTYTLRRNPYSTSSTFCIGADGRSSFGRRERGPGPPKRGARIIMAACTHID